jgi:hypothetical protein
MIFAPPPVIPSPPGLVSYQFDREVLPINAAIVDADIGVSRFTVLPTPILAPVIGDGNDGWSPTHPIVTEDPAPVFDPPRLQPITILVTWDGYDRWSPTAPVITEEIAPVFRSAAPVVLVLPLWDQGEVLSAPTVLDDDPGIRTERPPEAPVTVLLWGDDGSSVPPCPPEETDFVWPQQPWPARFTAPVAVGIDDCVPAPTFLDELNSGPALVTLPAPLRPQPWSDPWDVIPGPVMLDDDPGYRPPQPWTGGPSAMVWTVDPDLFGSSVPIVVFRLRDASRPEVVLRERGQPDAAFDSVSQPDAALRDQGRPDLEAEQQSRPDVTLRNRSRP